MHVFLCMCESFFDRIAEYQVSASSSLTSIKMKLKFSFLSSGLLKISKLYIACTIYTVNKGECIVSFLQTLTSICIVRILKCYQSPRCKMVF